MRSAAAFYTPGVCYVTCATIGRQPLLRATSVVHSLLSALAQVKERRPFHLLAYVVLPDHLHLLMRPDEGETARNIVGTLRRSFAADYRSLMGMPGPTPVWGDAPTIRPLHSADEFVMLLDYVHYNPVYHRVAARPEEWPPSSYEAWVARKVYKLGWGWQMPEHLAGRRYE